MLILDTVSILFYLNLIFLYLKYLNESNKLIPKFILIALNEDKTLHFLCKILIIFRTKYYVERIRKKRQLTVMYYI